MPWLIVTQGNLLENRKKNKSQTLKAVESRVINWYKTRNLMPIDSTNAPYNAEQVALGYIMYVFDNTVETNASVWLYEQNVLLGLKSAVEAMGGTLQECMYHTSHPYPAE